MASFARGAGKEHPAGCGKGRILSIWFQNHCSEDNRHVTIGNQDYVLSYDGYLMPAKNIPARARRVRHRMARAG